MNGNRSCISVTNNRNVVEIILQLDTNNQEVDIDSSTTTLSIRKKSGEALLTVPQLYSTVDASKTSWSIDGSKLKLKLVKLDPSLVWPGLEYEETIQPQSLSATSKPDTAAAIEARDTVKQLFEAAISGDLQKIKQVGPELSTEGLASIKDGNGRNVLHFAAQAGQTEALKYLLDEEGIDANSFDESGESALGLAAGAGHLQAVRVLLSHGASTSSPNEKLSCPQPLHRAAAAGCTDVLAALLEAGADIEAASESGTPLLWAAGSSSHEVVAKLLAAGANSDAQSPIGVTAMIMAAAAGDKVTVEILIKHGANPNLAADGGVTALHAAVETGDLQLVKSLIKAGADPNAEDEESGAKAIQAAASAGNAAIVEYLLPLTRPQPGATWSVAGLLADTSSAASTPSPLATFPELEIVGGEAHDPEKAATSKRAGDEAFVARKFEEAAGHYSESLKWDTRNKLVWANRSAAHLRCGHFQQALADARSARSLDEKYMKAWYREGEAAKALELWEDAAQAYYEAFTLDPNNEELAQAFQAAVAAGRAQHAAKTNSKSKP